MSGFDRRSILEAQSAAALARLYKPVVSDDVVFVTRETLRGLFERDGLSQEKADLQVSAAISLGGSVRVGRQLYEVHDSPCRHCGGSGKVLERKLFGFDKSPCDRCFGKGFIDE